jgi:uncharacterized protein
MTPPDVVGMSSQRKRVSSRPLQRPSLALAGKSARDSLAPLSREVKFAGAPLSHVEVDGTFEGYASLFGVVDLGKDLVEAGAFKDSVARRGAAGVKLLWSHDPGEPIGHWEIIREDVLGLKVRGRLNLDVARAREVHSLMKSGAIDGLSIGFKTVEARRDPRSGIRRLQKIDLWEVSLVTFPMLPQARVSAVKQALNGKTPHPLSHAMRAITKATRIMQQKDSVRP